MPIKILPQKCEQQRCPSFKDCHNVASVLLHPKGVTEREDVDILFVSEIPFLEDLKEKQAFSNSSSSLLTRMVRRITPDRPASCGFTSLLRCRPEMMEGEPRQPEALELDLCRTHLIADLAIMKPKVLLCHGLQTLKNITDPSIHRFLRYNKVEEVEFDGVHYYAIALLKTGETIKKTQLLTHLQEGITKGIDLAYRGEESMYHPARWRAAPITHYCDTVAKVKKMVKFLLHDTNAKQTCSFDVETRNLNSRYGNALVTLQFCVDPWKEVWVVPYNYQHGPFMQEDLDEITVHLRELFTTKPKFKYWLTHYGVFEQQQVMEFLTGGKTFRNAPTIDVMSLAYILDENRVETAQAIKQGLGLKDLTSEYLSRNTYDTQILSEREIGNLYKLPPDRLIPYAAEDVINTSMLFRYFRAYARSHDYWDKALKLAQYVFAPAFRTFPKLKRNGMFADLEHLRVLSSRDSPLTKRMAEILEEINLLPNVKKANAAIVKRNSGNRNVTWGKPPWTFNINKAMHKEVLFFDIMGLTPVFDKKNKTKKKSVGKLFYEKYASSFEEVQLAEEYAQLKKLATGYTRKILKIVDPNSDNIDCNSDCRVRADFGFTNTVTGRPSCVAGGTQIAVPGGTIPIEDIELGQIVYCYTAMGDIVTNKVSWAGPTGQKKVVSVNWVDASGRAGRVRITRDHAVRTEDGLYVAAEALVQGDVLAAADGIGTDEVTYGERTVVSVEDLDELVDVYDLTVEDEHNFIADEICIENCANPNIQNVPRADNATKASVKSMYCAMQSYGAWRPGNRVEKVLMQLDYKAAEVRWWAIISGDKVLAEAIRRGKMAADAYRKNPTPELKKIADLEGDIHSQTASLMFGVPLDKVSKALRQQTKAIVFALIYGGGPKLIAERIKNPDIEAVRKLCDDFAKRFPAGSRWLKQTELNARQNLFVESPIGRRRRLPEYLMDTSTCGQFAEFAQAKAARLARNAPIQGIASDGCIIGAGLWLDWIEENDKPWDMVNIVHDSCVTEIPIEDMEEAAEQAEKSFTVRMMNLISDTWGVEFICPMEIDLDFGIAWGTMDKLDWTKNGFEQKREWLTAGGLGSILTYTGDISMKSKHLDTGIILTDTMGRPLPGQSVKIKLGDTEAVSVTTNSDGVASSKILIPDVKGSIKLEAKFGGSPIILGTSFNQPIRSAA